MTKNKLNTVTYKCRNKKSTEVLALEISVLLIISRPTTRVPYFRFLSPVQISALSTMIYLYIHVQCRSQLRTIARIWLHKEMQHLSQHFSIFYPISHYFHNLGSTSGVSISWIYNESIKTAVISHELYMFVFTVCGMQEHVH